MLSKVFHCSFAVLGFASMACGDDGMSSDAPETTSTGGTSSSVSTEDSTASRGTDAGRTGAEDDSTGDADSSTGIDDGDPTNDVFGLIIRRLNAGQDQAEFESARDAYRDALFAQPGSVLDREYRSTVDFSTGMPPEPAVFIGATQFTSAESFQAGAGALNGSEEETTFFGTFAPEYFAILAPLDGGPVDISVLGSGGQMLEVAPRDLSQYENFDAASYAQARDAFIDVLASQPGVIAEYQWVSPADPNVAVGMTVYESQDAWQQIWSDPAFLNSAEFGAFIGDYPPNGGYLSEIVDTIGQ